MNNLHAIKTINKAAHSRPIRAALKMAFFDEMEAEVNRLKSSQYQQFIPQSDLF